MVVMGRGGAPDEMLSSAGIDDLTDGLTSPSGLEFPGTRSPVHPYIETISSHRVTLTSSPSTISTSHPRM